MTDPTDKMTSDQMVVIADAVTETIKQLSLDKPVSFTLFVWKGTYGNYISNTGVDQMPAVISNVQKILNAMRDEYQHPPVPAKLKN